MPRRWVKTRITSRTWQAYSTGDHTSGDGRSAASDRARIAVQPAVSASTRALNSRGSILAASKPHSAHGSCSTTVQSLVSGSGISGSMTAAYGAGVPVASAWVALGCMRSTTDPESRSSGRGPLPPFASSTTSTFSRSRCSRRWRMLGAKISKNSLIVRGYWRCSLAPSSTIRCRFTPSRCSVARMWVVLLTINKGTSPTSRVWSVISRPLVGSS